MHKSIQCVLSWSFEYTHPKTLKWLITFENDEQLRMRQKQSVSELNEWKKCVLQSSWFSHFHHKRSESAMMKLLANGMTESTHWRFELNAISIAFVNGFLSRSCWSDLVNENKKPEEWKKEKVKENQREEEETKKIENEHSVEIERKRLLTFCACYILKSSISTLTMIIRIFR